MSAVLVACAVVATTAGIGVAADRERPDQRTAATGDAPRVSCVLALPDEPAEVQTRVLDGGAPAGLTAATASQLRARSFTVLADAAAADPADTATLRYGPAAIGAASVLRAMVHGDVQMRFDPDRRDDTVDLILGPAFTRLATTTEVNQNLAAAGEPPAPPECVAAVTPTR